MKAITTQQWGLHPQLQIGQFKAPQPKANEVLVQVHAASVNPKDFKLNYQFSRLITPLGNRRLPPLFGDDLAGVVLACGSSVADFKPGDEIYGMDMRPRTASLAEQAVIDQRRIALKPKSLSYCEAAAMPLAALTALQGLRAGQAEQGKQVLIIGASGGVGTFAVQLAKIMQCHVTAVCSSRNIELVQQLGADAIIDYTKQYLYQCGEQFDLIFDVTSYETPTRIAALRKPEAWFISTGGHAAAVIQTAVASTRNKLIRVESWRKDLDELAAWVDAGQLRPIIDSQYDWSESEAAYQRSRSGRTRGKIVINVAGTGSSGRASTG